MEEAAWQEMIDINLTGAWKTVRAAAPAIVDGGRGGSIVLTSSVAGLMGFPTTPGGGSFRATVVTERAPDGGPGRRQRPRSGA